MTRALLGTLVLALAGTACAHADPAATASVANPAAASSTTSAHPAGMCPMSVPETKVLPLTAVPRPESEARGPSPIIRSPATSSPSSPESTPVAPEGKEQP